MEEKKYLSKKTKRKNDKNMPLYTKQDELKYNEKNKIFEKEKKLKEKKNVNVEEEDEIDNEQNESEVNYEEEKTSLSESKEKEEKSLEEKEEEELKTTIIENLFLRLKSSKKLNYCEKLILKEEENVIKMKNIV